MRYILANMLSTGTGVFVVNGYYAGDADPEYETFFVYDTPKLAYRFIDRADAQKKADSINQYGKWHFIVKEVEE